MPHYAVRYLAPRIVPAKVARESLCVSDCVTRTNKFSYVVNQLDLPRFWSRPVQRILYKHRALAEAEKCKRRKWSYVKRQQAAAWEVGYCVVMMSVKKWLQNRGDGTIFLRNGSDKLRTDEQLPALS